MKAFALHGAEDLRLEQKDRPAPGFGEVLIGVRAAGICGTDIHYFQHGRCGNFVPSQPFVLGHEFAGEVLELGEGTTTLSESTRVAVDPSRPCGKCRLCREGRYNMCPHMRYFGTASVVPPIDGCFSEYVVVPAANCAVLPEGFQYGWAALLEPLSVAAHAAKRSGSLAGKRVFVTGGGTIGQMILKMALAFGATQVVVSDLKAFARYFGLKQGATAALNPSDNTLTEQAQSVSPEGFDVVFEAAGAPPALTQAVQLACRGGKVVQVGMLPDGIPFPANDLLTRELEYIASWRFANVFPMVLDLIQEGRLEVASLITRVFPFEELNAAMEHAITADNIKVQIASEV